MTTLVITILLVWLNNRHNKKSTPETSSDFISEQFQIAKSIGIPKLLPELKAQLFRVPPSHDFEMEYRPCRVTLNSGEIVDNVYIVELTQYLKTWGILPSVDAHKKNISASEIKKIEESPNRLPPKLATKLYKAGESGMGYTIFTIVLADGNKIPIATGNAIDFVSLPAGYSAKDIIDVLPHVGRESNPQPGSKYTWCLYAD